MSAEIEQLDVLVVGAGISGIGAGYYLRHRRPDTSFAILDMRGAIGGTWDLFRYPGIRSDSDLHTFGYAFKPWTADESIASAELILDYLRETVEDNGLADHIRLHHKVLRANWSSADARWVVDVERTDTGQRRRISARWLLSAAGYYRYDRGHRPDFPGEELFGGQLVHPQAWPEDLDHRGRRVVVIGSGATAVTLIPAMAEQTAHITMLQRSPSYVMPVPRRDPIAMALKRLLGHRRGYEAARRFNIAQQRWVYRFAQGQPALARQLIRTVNRRLLPDGFDVDTHFNPDYDPWDQRLCAMPDGDLFRAIRRGQASVVTGRIATFTPTGIRLESGEDLEADIVVTATGLELQLFGGIEVCIDGAPVEVPERVAFRGMMLSDVPNFAFAVGYTNSSWTLKVDLVWAHLCRLLDHMDAVGAEACVPRLPEDHEMTLAPLLDFAAGYVQRSLHLMPRKGEGPEWQIAMDYRHDVSVLRDGPVTSPALRFGTATEVLAPRPLVEAG